jgi:hypothetical protein
MGMLEFLTREGCVNSATMLTRLNQALSQLGTRIDYRVVDLDTLTSGDRRTGYGTPTVLYNGRDIFGLPEPSGGREVLT